MCGIFCCILSSDCKSDFPDLSKFYLLQHRGPDSWHFKEVELSNGVRLLFAGSVLHLRGQRLIKQPVSNDDSLLLWNGEIFGGIKILHDENDTQVLFDKLCSESTTENLGKVLSQICGPWAFIYLDIRRLRLWFGRDFFGRRSLLSNISNDRVILSSVCEPCDEPSTWNDIPTKGIYYMDLQSTFSIKEYPWKTANTKKLEDVYFLSNPISTTINFDTIVPKLVDRNSIAYFTDKFYKILLEAIQKRTIVASSVCQMCCKALTSKKCVHCKVAVLFSGGVDSTVIAILLHKCLPVNETIDLINVAFEQKLPKSKINNNFDVPDRLTGRMALAEIKKIAPNRKWNFIEVDVTIEELKAQRFERIASLIKPACSVLDDSIGSAIWFAARGKGNIEGTSYATSAKILLLGMGADEQLAGYSRHRIRFNKDGWLGLLEEIQMDVNRISRRNLGRDDRIVSDHGRESRYPFLDEDVVSFLNQVPIWIKADLRLPRGQGEKSLLRSLANRLGLESVSGFAKRAIQFGTRIAKAECKGEKGNDVCDRLHQVVN